MFAKMPEGYNNPNSPDFPGLNSNGGLNMNTYSDNTNNNYNNNNNNNNNMDYPENLPDSNLINKVSQNVGRSWLDSINCNITFLQIYFDFETDDIIQRLIASLIPFNKNFINLVEKKPDLYGPFWIYTTLIFIIASAGSLTKYIQGATQEDYFQKFIPLAMSVIYGIGFCLPLIIKVLMYIFGSETAFVLVLNIYGYSFSIYGPIFILCIPLEQLQWLLLFYAVLSSTCFLLLNFWKELNKYVDNRKYFVLGVICIFQVSLYFVIKLKFFADISKKMNNY
jgi:hypothetical protein